MRIKESVWCSLIQSLLIFCWLAILTRSDSYYAPYLAVGMAGFGCVMLKGAVPFKPMTRGERAFTGICAALLSSTVVLANYKCVLLELAGVTRVLQGGLLFLGGWVSFFEIMAFLYRRDFFEESAVRPKDSKRLFLFCWVVLTAVYTTVLFGAQYPGVLTEDSIWQIKQILTQTYSNHHPFYHTQIIRLCMAAGYRIFGNMNAAVFAYSVFSICVMASCFSYVICTIDRATGKRKLSLAVFLWYLLMPFHIMYSFTMWKDVFFGAAATFFVTACYRMLRNIGNRTGDTLVMGLSALGICLLRSNGWAVFLATTVLFALLFGKKHFRLAVMCLGILVASYVLKHPVLEALHVTQPDTIESLSIPAQQIARVLTDGGELNEEQTELLSQVVNIEAVPGQYQGYLSDPVKELVRYRGNQELLKTRAGDFLRLYVQLGLKYPVKYLEAWIDQTRGYWNGGYTFWRWGKNITQNDMDIYTISHSEAIARGLDRYLECWTGSPVLVLAVCIGFHVWLMFLCIYAAAMKRNRAALFVSLPILMIWGTLLIATPVFSEFRYIYAMFCAMPLMVITALGKEREADACAQRA